MSPLFIFQSINQIFKDVLFPKVCINCRREGEFLCDGCKNLIRSRKFQLCYGCGFNNKDGRFCSRCREGWHLNRIIIAAYYDAISQALIKAYKYRFCRSIDEILGKLLAGSKKFANSQNLVVSFVPLSRKRLLWRGFNQAELLAKNFSKSQKLPISNLLKRLRHNSFQSYSSRVERFQNIKGAFEVIKGSDILGKVIILVDDVVTTGATLNECARVLKNAGAREVSGLVVASRKGEKGLVWKN